MRLKRTLALILLLVLIGLAYLAGSVGVGRALLPKRSEGIALNLRFPQIQTLDVGTSVRFRGVVIGKVSEAPYIDGEEVVVPIRIVGDHWPRLNGSSLFELTTRNYLTQEQTIMVSTPAADAPPLDPGATVRGKQAGLQDSLREALAAVPREFTLKHSLFDNGLPAQVSAQPNVGASPLRKLAVTRARIKTTSADGKPWDARLAYKEPDVYVVIKKHGVQLARTPVAADTYEPRWPVPLSLEPPLDATDEDWLHVEVWDDDALTERDPIANFSVPHDQQKALAEGREITLRGQCALELVLRGIID